MVEKLVRDQIPATIAAAGAVPHVRRAEAADMVPLLIRKLGEEAAEVAASGQPPDPEEIADVLEVLRALAVRLGLGWADIERPCAAKRAERAGFTEDWILSR